MRLMIEWTRVRIPLKPIGNFGNFLDPLCQCLSDETLKAVGPSYLVSMLGDTDQNIVKTYRLR